MMKTECFCKARETVSKAKTEDRWGENICSMTNFFKLMTLSYKTNFNHSIRKREFPGGPMVRTLRHFHYQDQGSIPQRGTKIPTSQKKKKAMSVGKKWANNMKKKKSQKKYKHLINMLYFIGCISVPRPMSSAVKAES